MNDVVGNFGVVFSLIGFYYVGIWVFNVDDEFGFLLKVFDVILQLVCWQGNGELVLIVGVFDMDFVDLWQDY